jgi:hypothetical protein
MRDRTLAPAILTEIVAVGSVTRERAVVIGKAQGRKPEQVLFLLTKLRTLGQVRRNERGAYVLG